MNPSNIAIHQSRHQAPLVKATNSLRPAALARAEGIADGRSSGYNVITHA